MKLKNILLILILFSSIMIGNELAKPFLNQGHQGTIKRMITFSNDKYTLSCATDNIIKLWDTKKGTLIKEFKGHDKSIVSILITKNNKYLISGSYDKSIKIWDIEKGKLIHTLQGHEQSITDLKILNNDTVLLSLDMNNQIILWDLNTFKILKRFSINTKDNTIIQNIHILNDRYIIYTPYYLSSYIVYKYDLITHKKEIIYRTNNEPIGSLLVSKNNELLLMNLETHVKIMSLKNSNIINTIKLNDYAQTMTISDNNKYLVLGHKEGKITIYDLETNKIFITLNASIDTITSVKLIDKNSLLIGDRIGNIKVYSIIKQQLNEFGQNTLWTSQNFSNKQYEIFGNYDNLYLFDKYSNTIKYNFNRSRIITLSVNENYCIVANKNNSIIIYDLLSNVIKFNLNKDLKNLKSIVLSTNNKFIIAIYKNDLLKIWDIKNGKLIREYKLKNLLKIKTQDNYLITKEVGGTVKLWSLKNGMLIKNLTVKKSISNEFTISSSAQFIATEDKEHNIKLFNTYTKGEKTINNNENIRDISISNNDKYIAILDSNNLIKIYDLETLQNIQKLESLTNNRIISSFFINDFLMEIKTPKSIIYWNIKTNKKVLKFILFNNEEWIKITPKGFFDSSKNGAKYLNILTGTMKVSTIDNFYNAFYRPDLIQKVLNGEDISKYTKDINLRKIIKDGSAPEIKIIIKSQKIQKRDLNLNLQVCTIDDGGYNNLTLYLNGMAVDVIDRNRALKLKKQNRTRKECFTIDKLISLSNGKNTIGFKATNKAGTIESNLDEIVVNYKGRSNSKPNLHILAIGVDKYRDGDLWLKYSKADAKEFTKSIKKVSKPLFKNIYTYKLLDKDVTKSKILDMFSKIGAKTTREDVFMLYIAGHGITDAKTGAYFYLPVDF
ncbi:MAG: WD40 repeat domain-containing protein, partial [Campylobacterota bacterium]|nr:WD40 repeat domain-containing protein [Campylobacterota bacterium]